jgi:hypothetical protein
VLKSLISEGVRKYDFLGGTDESKVRWGAVVNNYINLEFAPPFTRGSIHLNLKNWSLGAKIWLRRQLPMPIWQRLKGLAGRTPDSANNLKQRW